MRRIASCQTCIWQYAPCDTSRCARSVGGESSGRLSSIYSIPGLRSALPAGAQAGGPIVAWVAVVGWWWVRQTTWLHKVRNLGQQHRQACVRHGCEREITRDRGNLRAPLRRKFREISDASREFSRCAASHSVGYLPTAKRSDRDRARRALKSQETYVWYGSLRELYLLVPFRAVAAPAAMSFISTH